MIAMKRLIFLLASFLCFQLAEAQVEVNVKLSTSNPSLKSLFTQFQGQELTEASLPSYARQQQNWLGELRYIQALTSAGRAMRSPLGQWFTLHLASDQVASLRQSGNFDFVEVNQTYSLDGLQYTPNDDSLAQQWYHRFIQSEKAWDISRGAPNVKVGVIDTGLDFDHPEFQGQLWINALEDANGNGSFEPWPSDSIFQGLPGDFDGIDGDGNGFVDDVVGYDFTDQPRSPFGGDFLFEDPYPLDDNVHGTAVSGVIHAKENNGLGIAGLAPRCKLMVLRAFALSGGGEDDDIARAIVYAADNGVNVLNLSFGDNYPSQMMHEAIIYAYNKGVVLVASAGNGNGDKLHYPSGFDEVISVSASTANLATDFESLWPLSGYGLNTDLCAPGSNILTTSLVEENAQGQVSQFFRIQGTSFSAPLVSGAAALLISQRGPLSPQQIRGILTSTADNITQDGEGWNHFTGAGRLNVFKALRAAGTSRVQITSPSHDSGSEADEVAVVGSVLDPEFLKYHIEYQVSVEGEGDWIPILQDQAYQVADDTLAIWTLDSLEEGNYTLRIRLEKTNGSTAEDRIRFVRDLSPAQIEFKYAGPCWDNQSRKQLFVFRSNDAGNNTLYFRQKGSPTWKKRNFDGRTRNGEFLLGQGELGQGDFEAFIENENFSGLKGYSDTLSFTFFPASIPQFGYIEKSFRLPAGWYLPQTFDLDEDQQPEVIMNQYDESLSFGQLNIYEFRGGIFVKADSSTFRGILIPREVGDIEGDGSLEMLVSANDSAYVLTQSQGGRLPSEPLFSDEGEGRFAARLANTDLDPRLEIITKDEKDYFILDGADFTQEQKLEDNSGGFDIGIAPRVLVEDFDGDGNPEIAFGDGDGDLLIYEYRGGEYVRTFLDTTQLSRSGNLLTAGDFDGDEQKEIFVATYPDFLENEDFENNPAYMVLRIFRSNGNDSYELAWKDALYDVDTDRFNAATAGNLDGDAADELAITSAPRTFVLDFSNGTYQMDWFYPISLATHHIIHDFDQNGVAELGLGIGDSTYFFEKELNRLAPPPVEQLQGFVINESSVSLSWPPSAGATAYEIWRVRDPLNNDLAAVLEEYQGNTFVDNNLDPNTLYLYVLKATQGQEKSGFGNAIFLTPHKPPRLDSAEALTDRQVMLYFSEKVVAREEDKAKFLLNGTQSPNALLQTGANSKRLIATFSQGLEEGRHSIEVDSSFQDADLAFIEAPFTSTTFSYEEELSDCLILKDWRIAGEKEVVLKFDRPLDESLALDSANYRIDPGGFISEVRWEGEKQNSVRIEVGDVRLGALGYAVSITADLCTPLGVCTCGEGNTATFSSFKEDLSEVFVYPNPYVKNDFVDGIRFAHLTKQATVEVYSLSGRFIQRLEENDGDGGLEWNLRDESGLKLKPGVYLYKVSTRQEGVESILKKFTVVE